MAMYQFRGETNIIGHNHSCALFISYKIRCIRKANLYAARGEQRVPKREILVHVQASWNADRHVRVLCFRVIALEKKFIFQLVDIATLFFVLSIRENLFTSIPRIVIFPIIKMITGNQALVVTSFTIQQT